MAVYTEVSNKEARELLRRLNLGKLLIRWRSSSNFHLLVYLP